MFFDLILFSLGAILSAGVIYVMHKWAQQLRASIAELSAAGGVYGDVVYVEGGHAAKAAGQEVPQCAGKTVEYHLGKSGTEDVALDLVVARRLLRKALSGRFKGVCLLIVCLGLIAFTLLCGVTG